MLTIAKGLITLNNLIVENAMIIFNIKMLKYISVQRTKYMCFLIYKKHYSNYVILLSVLTLYG